MEVFGLCLQWLGPDFPMRALGKDKHCETYDQKIPWDVDFQRHLRNKSEN